MLIFFSKVVYLRPMMTGQAKVLAVMGDPIAHSSSPHMHNTVCRTLGLNYVYIPLHVTPARLLQSFAAIKELGIVGFNVTLPHKEHIISLLDHVSERAIQMGAVNTVYMTSTGFCGDNTDGDGFYHALRVQHQKDVEHQHIAIVGAGGTARALAMMCLEKNCASIAILNRTTQRAQALCNTLKQYYPNHPNQFITLNTEKSYSILHQVDIVINTTSVGMAPNVSQCPIEKMDWVTPQHSCVDVIYTPWRTAFLERALERGAAVANGTGMLAAQAMFAFEKFTGVKANYDLFYNALLDAQT